MTVLFLAETLSFDDVLDGSDIPQGAVEITWDERQNLLAGQSIGKKIVADEAGFPILVDRPAPERDFLSEATEHMTRLRLIADYAIKPLQYAVDVEESTESSLALLKAWKKYYVRLTDVPSQAGYPETIDWPTPPV